MLTFSFVYVKQIVNGKNKSPASASTLTGRNQRPKPVAGISQWKGCGVLIAGWQRCTRKQPTNDKGEDARESVHNDPTQRRITHAKSCVPSAERLESGD